MILTVGEPVGVRVHRVFVGELADDCRCGGGRGRTLPAGRGYLRTTAGNQYAKDEDGTANQDDLDKTATCPPAHSDPQEPDVD